MNPPFHISTDKNLLDINLIESFLSNRSHWAKGRSRQTIERSIENSLCFGIYDGGNKQVGFARVVSDFAVFAWLMDVFIVEECRGKGLGKQLIASIMSHEKLQEIKRWGLATKDAHGLYEQYGFKSLSAPERMMEFIK